MEVSKVGEVEYFLTCSVMSSVVGLTGDVSHVFVPVNPAYVGDDSPGQAYGDPLLSGCDWLKSPQGKA